jgi:hypothetical protein
MKLGLLLLAAVASLLPGCAIPVTDEEIDWRFPVLSKQGCPDLTGTYADESEPLLYKCRWCNQPRLRTHWLFLSITGGLRRPLEGVTISTTKMASQQSSDPSRGDRISVIRQTNSFLEIERIDDEGIAHIKGIVHLSHPRMGCHDGALIIRNVANLIGSEGGSGSVQYSETTIRKMPDGRIRVTVLSGDRYRSKLTGKAYGPALDAEEKSWIFNPIKR